MDNSVQPIYEDVDLRPYIEKIIAQWRWMVALPIVTAIITLLITSTLPVRYESTALVAVTNPRFQLINSIDSADPATPFRAYPELALSDDLVSNLYEAVEDELPSDFRDRQRLHNTLSAENGADPSLIRLTVNMEDAATAALVTNAWADLFVERANFVFGNQGQDALVFFEAQLVEAEQKLDVADAALVEFQSTNRQVPLSSQLTVLSEASVAYQEDLLQIRTVLEEVSFMQTQALAESAELSTADVLAGLILQTKALNIDSQEEATGQALQVQLTGDTLNLTPAGQKQLLDRLHSLLVAKQSSLEVELLRIDDQIIETQTALQEISGISNRLEREREVAAETYASLARKVEETRISSQESASQVQLASRAAVPLQPVGLSPLVKSILAAVVVLLGSVGVSFLLQWWRQGRRS